MQFLILLCILAIGGRWSCSTICPLGIIEELLFKIPFPKKIVACKWDRKLRMLKYALIGVLLVWIPVCLIPNREQWEPMFLFVKLFGFTTIFCLSVMIYRPFCKYLCPFGVFLGLFNKITPFSYQVDETCNQCGLCKRKCKMGLSPYLNPNDSECIRCGACLQACPRNAIKKKEIK